MAVRDPFGTSELLTVGESSYRIFRPERIPGVEADRLARRPLTVRILLENLLRNAGPDGPDVATVRALAHGELAAEEVELPFYPGRVLLQDFTGVPVVVDLAAIRAAVAERGRPPERVNPGVPIDLIVDHSVQVDSFRSPRSPLINLDREYERNGERYGFLRWGSRAFRDLRVVPSGNGICHQVNLEYLASVVATREQDGEVVAFPDTVLGTDSHTPMVNGLSVLGWGVGGIEVEAVLLGEPYFVAPPRVVGVRLTGRLPEGATATDLVLTVTRPLRAHGVVDTFVEF
jgi:aconitate hydratase A / 2-methylisocitrate dehydratase